MVKVDFHCHLDFKDFDIDREDLILKLQEQKIIAISNTINRENYEYTRKLFDDIKNVKVTPGLYPTDAEKITDDEFLDYINFLRKNKNDFIAIGEIGLDAHITKSKELLEIQENRFRKLIELGIEIDKPLIIHTRKQEQKVLEIIEEYVNKYNFHKFNLHCFTGKKKLINKIKELNIYVSIPLTILNTESFEILVSKISISNILVETDSPFLNPQKKRNSPLNIPLIYEKIASIKGFNKEEIENIIYKNYINITN